MKLIVNRHQQIKRKEKKTNHKVPAVYVAQQIIEQKGLQYKYGSVEVSTIGYSKETH